MQNFWEKWSCSKGTTVATHQPQSARPLIQVTTDPENLLAMLQTWQNGDVSKQAPYNGDFEKAMASINAKTLVLPGKTDLYFP